MHRGILEAATFLPLVVHNEFTPLSNSGTHTLEANIGRKSAISLTSPYDHDGS